MELGVGFYFQLVDLLIAGVNFRCFLATAIFCHVDEETRKTSVQEEKKESETKTVRTAEIRDGPGIPEFPAGCIPVLGFHGTSYKLIIKSPYCSSWLRRFL